MKHIVLPLFIGLIAIASCKKENKKRCWECWEITQVGGSPKAINSEYHHDECNKNDEEIGQYVNSTRINLSDVPDGDTVKYINTCTEKK